MPNLVYYKDNSGVVSGPLKEKEATALFKANFFGPGHVFRVVDAEQSEEFISIDDLRTLNGAETPFQKAIPVSEKEETKELVRVYKELTTVLHQRNKLTELTRMQGFAAAREKIVEEFKKTMKEKNKFMLVRSGSSAINFTRIFNYCNFAVRVQYGVSWDPSKALTLNPSSCYVDIPGFQGGKYVFVAPFLSSDPLDGSDLVHVFNIFSKDKEELPNTYFP